MGMPQSRRPANNPAAHESAPRLSVVGSGLHVSNCARFMVCRLSENFAGVAKGAHLTPIFFECNPVFRVREKIFCSLRKGHKPRRLSRSPRAGRRGSRPSHNAKIRRMHEDPAREVLLLPFETGALAWP